MAALEEITPGAILIIDGSYLSIGQRELMSRTGCGLDQSVAGIDHFVQVIEKLLGLRFAVRRGVPRRRPRPEPHVLTMARLAFVWLCLALSGFDGTAHVLFQLVCDGRRAHGEPPKQLSARTLQDRSVPLQTVRLDRLHAAWKGVTCIRTHVLS